MNKTNGNKLVKTLLNVTLDVSCYSENADE